MSEATQSTQKEPRGISRLLPILQWAPTYDRQWFRPDLIAGLTVAALVVPKSLGYAGIAGVPIQHGLYAAAAGAIIYALFGTCKQIATGPSSALAAVAGGAVIAAGVSGGEEAVALVFDMIEREGLILGSSSGFNVAGALRLAKKLGPGHTIVTILCDYGTRYQSKLLNPAFLREKGLPVPGWLEKGAA